MYPWLMKNWQTLTDVQINDQLPHALLLESDDGMGGEAFALQWAQYILCENKLASQSCQECVSCHYFEGSHHPDYYEIDMVDGKKSIAVSQIRDLIDALEKTSQRHNYQVVVIKHADKMTIAAQNALLKTLEEPPGMVHFVLLTANSEDLAATIVSRCQKYVLGCEDKMEILRWFKQQLPEDVEHEVILKLSGWCPLLAVQYAEDDILKIRDNILKQLLAVMRQQLDPISLSVEWQQQSRDMYFLIIMTFVRDILALSLGGSVEKICHTDRAEVLVKLERYMDEKKLLQFWRVLINLQQRIQSAATPNKALVWDRLLLQWFELFNLEHIIKGEGVIRNDC